MRIQLIYPGEDDMPPTGAPTPPLGVLYVAEALRRGGDEVVVSNRVVEGFDACGATAMLRYKNWSLEQLERAKELGQHTVLGGPYTTGIGNKLLETHSFLDSVVDGHGEGVAYRAFRDRGVFIDHSASVPAFYPARDLVDMEHYLSLLSKQYGGRRMTSIMAGRGCVGKCKYCVTPGRWPKIAYRSPSNVVDEIIHLREKYGVDGIMFYDDCLNWSQKWLMDLCKELVERGPVGNVYHGNGRADRMNPELAKALKGAGFTYFSFGVESASPKMLKAMGKGETIEKQAAGLEAAYDAGLAVLCAFMFGLPGETQEDRELTLDFVKKAKLHQANAFDTLFLFPGTAWTKEYGTNPLEFELYHHPDAEGATRAMKQVQGARLIRHPYKWYKCYQLKGEPRLSALKQTLGMIYVYLFRNQGIEDMKEKG